jgi:phosphoglycerate dehydrogenase-like enzyme
MSILVLATTPFVEVQLAALRRLAPDEAIETDASAPSQDVEAILAIRLPAGLAERLPRLRFVAAPGAGIDGIEAASIPDGIPITRANDPVQGTRMAQHVSLAVLRWHREAARHAQQQRERRWVRIPSAGEREWTIGLMGYGTLGRAVAHSLATLGYPLRSWTRTPHASGGVDNFAGNESLGEFLSGTRVLVCLLPLTDATRGLLSARAFDALPRGAYVVNVSRGAIVDESALVASIERGHLAGAALDVFAEEPLPAASPLWRDERIIVTPHVAAAPDPQEAARDFLDNLARARRGEPLHHVVDRSRGY